MRILIYSNCRLDAALGSGKTRLRFSAGLRELGHEVRVVEPPEFELFARLRAGRRFRLALGAWRHARTALAREKVDLIEINGGEFGWLARRLHGRRARPLVVHRTDGSELLAEAALPYGAGKGLRRWTFGAAAGWLHRRMNWDSFNYADTCVTLSEFDGQHLQHRVGKPADRMLVVPPGLDDEFLAQPEPGPRKLRLAFLGSWVERKGIGPLVSAASDLLAQHGALELELLGTGRSEDELRRAFPPEARSRVFVAQRLTSTELAARLAHAAIFVFPSLCEGYGMATAEAMACGCAVVTTRTGFGGDLCDGQDALLVPFGDAPSLARSLRHLAGDPILLLRIAKAGWRRVQGNRWPASVRMLEEAYRRWSSEQNRHA